MCHATHCWALEEDFRIYKNTKMFYVLLHHSPSIWFRRRHFSVSMFLFGWCDDVFTKQCQYWDCCYRYICRCFARAWWPGGVTRLNHGGRWREYWCGNDINGAVLLQLMETCSSPPPPDTDKLSCTALHAGTCTGRWSHPGAAPIFRKQNTDLIKLP